MLHEFERKKIFVLVWIAVDPFKFKLYYNTNYSSSLGDGLQKKAFVEDV